MLERNWEPFWGQSFRQQAWLCQSWPPLFSLRKLSSGWVIRWELRGGSIHKPSILASYFSALGWPGEHATSKNSFLVSWGSFWTSLGSSRTAPRLPSTRCLLTHHQQSSGETRPGRDSPSDSPAHASAGTAASRPANHSAAQSSLGGWLTFCVNLTRPWYPEDGSDMVWMALGRHSSEEMSIKTGRPGVEHITPRGMGGPYPSSWRA